MHRLQAVRDNVSRQRHQRFQVRCTMSKKIAIKGNEAISETAIRCGLDFFAGYPITPQTEMLEYISRRLPQEGKVFVQAESEIGSSKMIMGAAIGGARAMTATSGPGLALMAEVFSNLGIGRLPTVIVDVQCAFNTISPCQSDYNFLVKGLGHGGTRAFVTAPMNVQEAVNCTELSFEKAWDYCVPAVLLIDGMLGQTTEGVILPEKKTELPPPRYPVPTGRGSKPQRTFQLFNGNYKGMFGEDAMEACLMDSNAMYRKWVDEEVRYAEHFMDDAEYVIFAWGSCARICLDAIKELRAEGHKVGMFRPITLYPFPEKQIQAMHGYKAALSVEMALPEQFYPDVAVNLDRSIPLSSYTRCGGNLVEAGDVAAAMRRIISAQEGR